MALVEGEYDDASSMIALSVVGILAMRAMTSASDPVDRYSLATQMSAAGTPFYDFHGKTARKAQNIAQRAKLHTFFINIR